MDSWQGDIILFPQHPRGGRPGLGSYLLGHSSTGKASPCGLLSSPSSPFLHKPQEAL